ncbi:MAG TPA: hypothetical protein VF939_10135 [Puia sp.]
MLIPLFFVTEVPQTEDIHDVLLPEGASLVFRIKINELDLIRSFYRSLVAGDLKTPFSLLVESDSVHAATVSEELISYLISFTLHYKYLNLRYKTPFIIFKSSGDGAYDLISLLRKRLMDQGYGGIDYIDLDAEDTLFSSSLTHRKWVTVKSGAETVNLLSAAYYEALKSNDSGENSLLFFLHSATQLSNLIRSLTGVEEDLLRHSPSTYYLLERVKTLESAKKEIESEIGILEEKADSLKSYYTFYNQPDSGYKKKIAEIVEFYKNEYEILPLWYKRFGHIIKVLTGKRTFRSLYNDNVKKYK